MWGQGVGAGGRGVRGINGNGKNTIKNKLKLFFKKQVVLEK